MRAAVIALSLTACAAVPEFDVDLDLPPEQRWLDMSLAYREQIPALMATWAADLGRHLTTDEEQMWLDNHNLEDEFIDEMRGIVQAVNDSSVTLERVILYNLLYNLHFPSFSSGVVAATPDGTTMHGRNFDYAFSFVSKGHHKDMAPMVFDVTYYKNGEPLYTAVHTACFVGINTGMRMGAYSVQANTRPSNDMAESLAAAEKGYRPFNFLARRVLEEQEDFDAALFKLSTTKISAPTYFVIAGINAEQGSVVVREREDTNTEALDPEIGRWFVQANDDPWMPHSGPVHGRRLATEAIVGRIGQAGVDQDAIQRVMLTPPMFTSTTLYTWIANPSTGEHKTLSRDDAIKMGQVAMVNAMVGNKPVGQNVLKLDPRFLRGATNMYPNGKVVAQIAPQDDRLWGAQKVAMLRTRPDKVVGQGSMFERGLKYQAGSAEAFKKRMLYEKSMFDKKNRQPRLDQYGRSYGLGGRQLRHW